MASYIQPNEIILGDIIGDGASAVVHKANWNGKTVAVKKFDGFCPSKMLQDFKKEIEILSKINHDNIVKLFGYCDQRNNTFLVSEIMEGGSLLEYIHRSTTYDWKNNLNLIKDVTNGMVYLHENKILHLDLKSLNILLNKEKTFAKINDFGLSQISTITSTISRGATSRHAQGTTRYMACEIAKGIQPTYKADVWSFACILIEFATRDVPFKVLPDNVVFTMLQTDTAEMPLNLNNNTPHVIAALISKCLVRDPKLRPTFGKIQNLLKNVDSDMLKVTIKTQQTEIASIPQDANIANTQSLKTLIDDIKTKRNDANEAEAIEQLTKSLSRIALEYKQIIEENQRRAIEAQQQLQNAFQSSYSYYDYSQPVYSYVSSPSSYSGVPTGTRYVSSGSANGSQVYLGPRGGRYIMTRSGRKRYV